MKLALLSLLALAHPSRALFVPCVRCDICPGQQVQNPDLVVTVDDEAATCDEWFLFSCSFIPPNACDATQAALSECCGGTSSGDAELDVSGADSCPDGTGCDICPEGTIADDGLVVTVEIDGVDQESATCAEWFAFACGPFVEPDVCDDFQEALAGCCTGATAPDSTPEGGATETTAEPETTAAAAETTDEPGSTAAADAGDSSSCPDGTGCHICPEGHLIDEAPATTAMFRGEEERCDEWFLYGCIFFEPDACPELQAAMTDCCTSDGAAGDAPQADASQDGCPDSTGCDVCPEGTIVDDNKVATVSIPDVEAESATCGEWFLFGCTFAEPDICTDLQGALAEECCTGSSPDTTPGSAGDANDSSTCPDGTGCHICPEGHLIDEASATTAMYLGEAERCDEWFVYGCVFSWALEGNCLDLQEAMTDCCTSDGVAGDAPQADESGDGCPDSTGCDICPEGAIVDDSIVATIDVPSAGATESATCGEWFLFGCTFAEPDICTDLQGALKDECCGTGTSPDSTPGATEPGSTEPGATEPATTGEPETTTAPPTTSTATQAGTILAGAAIGLLMLA